MNSILAGRVSGLIVPYPYYLGIDTVFYIPEGTVLCTRS